jgi:hypothetical protein
MFSTEMKGMAKEPEESSGRPVLPLAVDESNDDDKEEVVVVLSCEGGGPKANESDKEDDVDVAVGGDGDEEADGMLSELDLRKLLINEFVESVRADSVEDLHAENQKKST